MNVLKKYSTLYVFFCFILPTDQVWSQSDDQPSELFESIESKDSYTNKEEDRLKLKDAKKDIWEFLYDDAKLNASDPLVPNYDNFNYQPQAPKNHLGTLSPIMQTLSGDSLSDSIAVSEIAVKNKRDYQTILEKYGFYDFEDVSFRVQIGAFKDASAFDLKPYYSFGKIQNYTMDDGIVRFTIGDFSYLRQADDLKLKIREKLNSEAFVVVFNNDKRAFDFNFEQ